MMVTRMVTLKKSSKFLKYRFRDFFQYQNFPIPVPRLFLVPIFSNTGSDTTKNKIFLAFQQLIKHETIVLKSLERRGGIKAPSATIVAYSPATGMGWRRRVGPEEP